MYGRLGGRRSFQIFSLGALVVCVCHIFIRPSVHRHGDVKTVPPTQVTDDVEGTHEEMVVMKEKVGQESWFVMRRRFYVVFFKWILICFNYMENSLLFMRIFKISVSKFNIGRGLVKNHILSFLLLCCVRSSRSN